MNSNWTNRWLATACLGVLTFTMIGCLSRPDLKPQYEPGPQDADAPTDFVETSSGLRYRILRESDGRKAGPTDSVTCHYRGWLDDGTVFDASYSGGKPLTFGLFEVIPGWTEGLQLVGEGGMIELEIPYQLGYGEKGNASIPGGATLHFIVELLEVE